MAVRTKTIEAQSVPGGFVIGSRTRLLDVWSPSPMVLRAPSFDYPRHELRFTLEESTSTPPPPKGKRLSRLLKARLNKRGQHVTIDASKIYFDARFDSTGNIAHILQAQAGVVLMALEEFGMPERANDVVMIAHSKTPSFCLELYNLLGFEVIADSHMSVSGTRIRMIPSILNLRPLVSKYLRNHAVRIGLLSADTIYIDNIFIARRSRRTCLNLEEVESMTRSAGFRTYYPEDDPVDSQIRTIACAPKIIGMHGAALGQMMFRDPQAPCHLIECFSCGYANNWARSIAHTTNCMWGGLQGDLDGKTISNLQKNCHSRQHEADNYHIDPESLRLVLRLTDEPLEDLSPSAQLELIDSLARIQAKPRN